MPDDLQLSPTSVHALRNRLGGYHSILQWYRTNRPNWWWTRVHRLGRVSKRYLADHGTEVRRGAFAGLVYVPDALGRVGFISSKLLGAYEPKVVAALDALAPDHEVFVDIGAAEGYFCIGLARNHPHLDVIGYELTERERVLSDRMCRLNGVRYDIRVEADHEAFARLDDRKTMILVDVEGYERELLDPAKAPRLTTATMVVELHEPDAPGITDLLRERFAATHDIEVLEAERDDASLYPELAGWDDLDAKFAMSDGRGYLGRWMVLVPTAGS